MKFKLFFGLVLVFASFANLTAQSFLPAEQAVTELQNAVQDLKSGATTIQGIPASPNTAEFSAVSSAPAVSSGQVTTSYASFLNQLIGEIKTNNDTQAGYNAFVARLAAKPVSGSRTQFLNDAKSYALGLITN